MTVSLYIFCGNTGPSLVRGSPETCFIYYVYAMSLLFVWSGWSPRTIPAYMYLSSLKFRLSLGDSRLPYLHSLHVG